MTHEYTDLSAFFAGVREAKATERLLKDEGLRARVKAAMENPSPLVLRKPRNG